MNRAGRGFSLVELMVALAIGALALWGALALHTRGSADWRHLAAELRLHEQLSWAMEALRADALLAGYWGQAVDASLITRPAALRVRCRLSGSDATDWALRLEQPVEAGDNQWAPPCPLISPRAGSDLLVVRHAGSEPVPPDSGQLQLASELLRGKLFDDGQRPDGYPAAAPVHDVLVNAWYVSDSSSFDPDLSSLRMLSLVKPGRLEDQEIATGIENLQVQLGIDTNGDGRVDQFVNPSHPAASSGTVRALRLWLLARSGRPEAGADEGIVWQPPDGQLGSITPGVTNGYPGGYRRMAMTQTIYLRNAAAAE